MGQTSQADATAAPADVEINGNAYRMSPLTNDDIGEFDRWLQQRFMKSVRASFTDDMTQRDRQTELDAAMRRLPNINIASAEAENAFNTVDGLSMALWLCIRHNDEKVSYEQIRGDVLESNQSDPSEMEQILTTWAMLNGGSASGKANGRKKTAGKKKMSRKSKSR